MPTLLHIEASPRGPMSRSSDLARRYIGRHLSLAPAWELDHLDLWAQPLPELEADLLAAKYARLQGAALDTPQAAAWRVVEDAVARLDRADRIVVSTPMWNFGIPYRLKHYIDLVTQPGLTFSFEPVQGYAPLLRPRPVDIILSSAGDYRSGPSRGRPDLATPYLQAAFAFIGLADARVVRVGPTVGSGAETAAATAAAEADLGLIGA